MKTKIFVLTHKKFIPPEDSMYIPLQVGAEGRDKLGYLTDDTGNNISALNCYYSELTGAYWVKQNVKDCDYIGLCHYRRYLIKESGQVFSQKEIETILNNYDLMATKKVELNYSYREGFSANHNVQVLDETGRVIQEFYPEYYQTFIKLVNEKKTYFGNMLITSATIYRDYHNWLFDIFDKTAKRVDLDAPDEYHRRVFGFISEFLLYVYVTVHHYKVMECLVGMIGEKAETRELKEQLAQYFKKEDVQGAKDYFLRTLEKRPDVLMEASDVTGELKLCMQVIATASQEQEREGTSILHQIHEFSDLMRSFEELNKRVRNNTMKSDVIGEIRFSPIAIQIARLLIQSADQKLS